MRTWGTVAVRVILVFMPLSLVACQTLIRPCGPDGDCELGRWPALHLAGPPHYQAPTMHSLACDLDHLERHIDCYGSVVAKVPDVWGQARLTRYREEFDKLMSPMAQENQFVLGLQGALSRSDQAFFASATALSMAAQPKPPLIGTNNGKPILVPQSRETTVVKEVGGSSDASREATTSNKFLNGDNELNTGLTDKTGSSKSNDTKTTTTTKEGQPDKPEVIKPIPLGDPKGLLSDPDNAIKRELVTKVPGFGGNVAPLVGIEPTLMIAQKKRYLDFLNQLRRENEGDDTADSPGYALNLVRIPVSILPGKKTDQGHGAEVTMTLTPILGDDLLPMTFRNLVANDLLRQLGFPLTQSLDDKKSVDLLKPEMKEVILGLPTFNHINELLLQQNSGKIISEYIKTLSEEEYNRLKLVASKLEPEYRDQFDKIITDSRNDALAVAYRTDTYRRIEKNRQEVANLTNELGNSKLNLTTDNRSSKMKKISDLNTNLNEDMKHPDMMAVREFASNVQAYAPKSVATNMQVTKAIHPFIVKFCLLPTAYSAGLLNKTGVPTSQITDVYGLSDVFQIAFAANDAFKEAIARQRYVHLPDVQGFLQQEIAAAYRFLREPECQVLWHQFCTPELVTAIRTRKLDQLQTYRECYRKIVEGITLSTKEFHDKRPYNELGQFSTTAALAWCIIVDSALLTDRLVLDMKEASTSKGQHLVGCEHWYPYFLPDPPQEARQAFNEYVKLRWPIHVFALDPYTQDQNISDQLSTRREMQLALAIAFTNGFLNAQNLTKYTRRLEAEYETIALNRTQVGFGHGENTFGWRFYPRFQSPDTESNLMVFARDMVVGGPNRNQLLRKRRLEPGPRECVAIVVMPSFVPYATLDVTTDWFALANPKHKTLDNTQALKLSRNVQAIKTRAPGIVDACDYRTGEFDRLVRKAEQLEARLPAQTLTVQVPILNTLGGFEMFSNGTTDLAPELYGWYGAPGVSSDDDATTLFLVGDHFSPLNSTVIVGNRAIAPAYQKMLSRQVMQVVVPKGTLTVQKDGKPHVTAHIATPYGVTRELLIPVISTTPEKPAPKAGVSVADAKLIIPYALKSGAQPAAGKDKEAPSDPKNSSAAKYVPQTIASDMKLKWVGLDPTAVTATNFKVTLVFSIPSATAGGPSTIVVVPCKGGVTAAPSELDFSDKTAPPPSGGDLVIKKAELNKIALQLFAQDSVQQLAKAGLLANGLKTTQVYIEAVAANGKPSRAVAANDQLTVQFKLMGYCAEDEIK